MDKVQQIPELQGIHSFHQVTSNRQLAVQVTSKGRALYEQVSVSTHGIQKTLCASCEVENESVQWETKHGRITMVKWGFGVFF